MAEIERENIIHKALKEFCRSTGECLGQKDNCNDKACWYWESVAIGEQIKAERIKYNV